MRYAITLLALFAFVGCNTPPKTVAYKSLATVAYTVDAAMTVYADAVVAQQIDPITQDKVRQLYQRYQAHMTIAVRAAQYDYATATPEVVAQIAAELTTLIFNLTK